jgi:GNAT superfamily N-acetyltransferase
MAAAPVIRPLHPADRAVWNDLWAGYLAFYRQALDDKVTETTWRRLIDPADAVMIGRVAVLDDRVVGLLHAVIHANTWSIAPVCYLEDLYVAVEARRLGVGAALIEALADEGRQAGWRRIYWRTASDNATAQSLYERVATRSRWVTYEIDLLEPKDGA